MIRYKLGFVAASVMTAALALGVGCDWSGGSGTDSFNSSRGAGVNVNFSGVYDGTFGGRAVKTTSAGNITRLNISQSGNSIEVVDNQGSKYTGNVGSPGAAYDLEGTAIPAGVDIVQSQITWSGKDNVSNVDIEFVGIIHVVAVTDIRGNTSTSGSSSQNTSTKSSTTTDNLTTTTTVSIRTNVVEGRVTTTVTRTFDEDGNLVYEEESVVTVSPSGDTATQTRVITDNRTKSSSSTSSSSSATTSTTTFQLTEANTQYRLEGTWIEKGGRTSDVDALSSGGTGSIVTTDTGTDTGTTTQ